jgi:hypothetical protein
LSPFQQPQPNTNPASSASQAANTTAGDAQSALSSVQQAFSAVPNALQSLTTGQSAATGTAAAGDPLTTISNLISIFVSLPSDLTFFAAVIPQDIAAGGVDMPFALVDSETGQHTDKIVSDWNGDDPFIRRSGIPSYDFPATILNPSPSSADAIAAGMADAERLGALSVPRNWTVAAPEVEPTAFSTPLTTTNAAAAPAAEAGAANTVNQMGIGGMAGQAMAGPPASGNTQESGKAVTHARLTPRVTGAASDGEPEAKPAPRTVVTGVAAAIRDIARQRAEGRLSEQEYTEQKKRLLEISSGDRPLA